MEPACTTTLPPSALQTSVSSPGSDLHLPHSCTSFKGHPEEPVPHRSLPVGTPDGLMVRKELSWPAPSRAGPCSFKSSQPHDIVLVPTKRQRKASLLSAELGGKVAAASGARGGVMAPASLVKQANPQGSTLRCHTQVPGPMKGQLTLHSGATCGQLHSCSQAPSQQSARGSYLAGV